MSQLTGNEFDGEKGSQGGLLKWIFSKFYPLWNNIDASVTNIITQLGNYYTKNESNYFFNVKANQVTTYTKVEVNQIKTTLESSDLVLDNKITLTNSNSNNYYNKSDSNNL